MNNYLAYKGWFSLEEIENMLPWERDVHMAIITERLDRIKQAQESNG